MNIAGVFFAGGGVGLAARDGTRVNHGAALLALAHTAAKFEGLFEGHPDRRGVPLGKGLHPQREDIDAPVGDAVMAQRQRHAALHMLAAPRLLPRAHALFEVADDAVGDGLIDIGFHGRLLIFGLQPLLQPCLVANSGVASARRLRTKGAEAPREGPRLRGYAGMRRLLLGCLARARAEALSPSNKKLRERLSALPILRRGDGSPKGRALSLTGASAREPDGG